MNVFPSALDKNIVSTLNPCENPPLRLWSFEINYRDTTRNNRRRKNTMTEWDTMFSAGGFMT